MHSGWYGHRSGSYSQSSPFYNVPKHFFLASFPSYPVSLNKSQQTTLNYQEPTLVLIILSQKAGTHLSKGRKCTGPNNWTILQVRAGAGMPMMSSGHTFYLGFSSAFLCVAFSHYMLRDRWNIVISQKTGSIIQAAVLRRAYRGQKNRSRSPLQLGCQANKSETHLQRECASGLGIAPIQLSEPSPECTLWAKLWKTFWKYF